MEDKILAVAAGVEIKESDVQALIKKYPAQQQAMLNSEEAKKNLLDQLIAYELFNKFGEELKINETDDYKEALKAVEKEILTSMTINKVLRDITVTDEELKNYYNSNKAAFGKPATVSARHILVEKEEDALRIQKEIEEGLSFSDAAMKYSTCPSNQQGGNLGEFSKGMMVPEFEKAAFEAEIGKVAGPVKTQFGYHLILVEGKKEASEKPFEEVKDQIAAQLIQIQQHKKYDEQVKELEAKYGVDRK